MGKLDTLLVTLEKDNKHVFYPGDQVAGRIMIITKTQLKIRNIRVKIDGKAKSDWIESKRTNDVLRETSIPDDQTPPNPDPQGGHDPPQPSSPHQQLGSPPLPEIKKENRKGTSSSQQSKDSLKKTVHHVAEQDYIRQEVLLVGEVPAKGKKTKSTTLAPGSYEHKFVFQLPPTCATSFEGQSGFIRYWIEATVDYASGKPEISRQPFSVICDYDLATMTTAAEPIDSTSSKEMKGLFKEWGSLSATVTLGHRGYVPGQPVLAEVMVNNQTTKVVRSIEARVVQTAKFQAFQRLNKAKLQVNEIGDFSQEVKVEPNSEESVKLVGLRVPSLPPVLSNCQVISVNHELLILVAVESKLSVQALEIRVPIIIGTKPIKLLKKELLEAPPATNPSYQPPNNIGALQLHIGGGDQRTTLVDPNDLANHPKLANELAAVSMNHHDQTNDDVIGGGGDPTVTHNHQHHHHPPSYESVFNDEQRHESDPVEPITRNETPADANQHGHQPITPPLEENFAPFAEGGGTSSRFLYPQLSPLWKAEGSFKEPKPDNGQNNSAINDGFGSMAGIPEPPPAYSETDTGTSAADIQNVLPSSFEDYALGKVDISEENEKNVHGDCHFAPRYPNYSKCYMAL